MAAKNHGILHITELFYFLTMFFISKIICIMSEDCFTIREHGFGGNLHNYFRTLPYLW